MVCPACSNPLSGATAKETSALASSIGELGQKLDGLAAAGKDVTHARGMLDIAISFLHTGKTEKAQQYLDRARAAIAELGG
jgi:hypothetical protein